MICLSSQECGNRGVYGKMSLDRYALRNYNEDEFKYAVRI